MPEIDPVILKLKVEHEEYLRDIRRATRLTEQDLSKIDRAGFATGVALKKGFNVAKAAAVSFAAALSVDLVVGAIKSGLDYASALGEVAQQLGVTTDALQEYRYAGSQAGLTNEEVDQALSQLTRRIGEAAAGTKEQAKAFETLGISLRDANGDIIDAGRAIPLIADAMKDIESPAQRAALLMDLFGRSGQKLEPLLSGGASAVNNLRNAAHELGIVLSEDQIQNADDAADKLDQVKQVLQARIAGVVADNAKEIIELANALANLADKAIKAAAAWLGTKRALGERDQMVARANAYLDGRRDLTPSQRAGAKVRAREIIDERNGFHTVTDPGGVGLFRLQRHTPTSKFAEAGPQSDFDRAIGGAPGQGRDIAALLGVDPVPVVAAATALADGLASLEADIAAARAELSGDLREQAAARKAQIDAELAETLARISDEEGISAETKRKRKSLETERATIEKQIVDKELQRDLDRQIADETERQRNLQQDHTRRELDALEAEAGLADTRKARLDVERRILDLRQQEERNQLEQQIADGEILDAKVARAALERQQSAERGGLERDFEGPLARYGREAADADGRVEEATARYIGDLRDTVSQTMARELGIKNKLVAFLISIFLDRAIFGPLARGLSAQGGGGGGLLGGIVTVLGSLFGGGRASGGRVSAGTMYRVNEGASAGRVEGFIPQGSGEIVPLGRMNAARGGGNTVVQHFHLDARGAVMTQDLVNQINTMGQVAADAGARGGHAASMNEIRKLQRPKL